MSTWDYMSVSPTRRDAAVADAAAQYRVTPAAVLGCGRTRDVAYARQLAMWLLRQRRRPDGQRIHSFPAIGAAFGTHHTTVIHADRRVCGRVLNGELDVSGELGAWAA